jgi:hypothetical protein
MAIQKDNTMVVLPEEEIYETNVYGKGLETKAKGGVNGEANIGLKGLINRTAWLKKKFNELISWKNSINLSDYALKIHAHPYLHKNAKAVDSDKLDGKDSSAFALSHLHPYLHKNAKAVDSDKLDGIDSYNFKSYAEFITFSNISFPSRAEESWRTVTSLNQMQGRCFDVLPNGIIKFKQNGVYQIKVKIVANSNIIGADKTRIKLSAWQKAAHFHPTNDIWEEVLVEMTCYLWSGYELRLEYDSGRLHTWHDARFSYINITRIGELQ